MSKELEATKARRALHIIERSVGEHEWFGWKEVETLETTIKELEIAIDELECANHNYNALKEFYNNAVAYGAKIQKELNELKKRNEPMKPIILTELEQVRPFPQTYKTVMCGNCKNQLSYNDKSRHCPDCGQAQDWSDEK